MWLIPLLSGFRLGDSLITHADDVGFLHDHQIRALDLGPCSRSPTIASGMKIPPAVFFSGSTRRIRTRSCNGRSFSNGPSDHYFARRWQCLGESDNASMQVGRHTVKYNRKKTTESANLLPAGLPIAQICRFETKIKIASRPAHPHINSVLCSNDTVYRVAEMHYREKQKFKPRGKNRDPFERE
jgi:hypothetical protein